LDVFYFSLDYPYKAKRCAEGGTFSCPGGGEDKLDDFPKMFDREIYTFKCDVVYKHIFENYYGEGRSVYASAY
jgi:hypothetical protein